MRTAIITATLAIMCWHPTTSFAQEAEDPRVAELTAQLAESEAQVEALAKEATELAGANERLVTSNEALRLQNAKRGWVLVNGLRRQVAALRSQMRKLQPRYQSNAQRWALMVNLYRFVEDGCVGGWDYNSSTSTSGSYESYSFSRWSTC